MGSSWKTGFDREIETQQFRWMRLYKESIVTQHIGYANIAKIMMTDKCKNIEEEVNKC